MNEDVLQRISEIVAQTREDLKEMFNIVTIDTSAVSLKDKQAETCETVARNILEWVDQHLDENILSVKKSDIKHVFNDQVSLQTENAKELMALFRRSGDFRPRAEVEEDESRVQALPVVVVRNRSGQVLRLRRRERREDNPLHQKLVIWAGGHVRQEDDENGDSILHCAQRELQEELKLSIETKDLILKGAVYADVGGKTAKHVALVYEWRADTDDVAVALSNAEFFERRGTSLSGKFVSMDELRKDMEEGVFGELWSEEIMKGLFASGSQRFQRTLFE